MSFGSQAAAFGLQDPYVPDSDMAFSLTPQQQQQYDYDARYSDSQASAPPPFVHHSLQGSPPSSTDSSPQHFVNGHGSSSMSRPGRIRAQSLTTKLQSMVGGKSTAHITQQQLNKKRQRATPEQLAVLEDHFEHNPSPNARQREAISVQIDMTERSVQIWFQNRRAKTKSASKRMGGASDDIFQQQSSHHRPGMPQRSLSIDQSMLLDYESAVQAKHHLTRLNCRSLTIGNWRRVACTDNDLVLYFSTKEPKFTYYINAGASGFKLEFPLSSITKVELAFLDGQVTGELGRITISVLEPPQFFMEVPGSGMWSQCTDFTEHQQATMVQDHLLVGPYASLKQSLVGLAHTYPTMTHLMTFPDVTQSLQAQHPSSITTPFSAPPDQELFNMAGQQAASSLDPEASKGQGMSRGLHRRTRSRSAPIALDFSFLHGEQVGGMPNYSFGQRSARPELHQQQSFGHPGQAMPLQGYPNLSMQNHPYSAAALAASQAMAPGIDYPELLFTPTTASTPVFGDNGMSSWYGGHPAAPGGFPDTPLLDGTGVPSTMASPMLPSGQHASAYDLAAQANLATSVPPPQQQQQQQQQPPVGAFMMQPHSSNEALMHFPAQSMPELLNCIPEGPMDADGPPLASPVADGLHDGTAGLSVHGGHAGVDLEMDLTGSMGTATMHGAGLQNAQLAAMVQMNMETNALIAQHNQQEQEQAQLSMTERIMQ